jgi:hypothetical protein
MRAAWFVAAVIALTLPAYLAGQRDNPPGFYNDESSVAWNALSIARTGGDEHGRPHPLFFQAFGEYKNPAYVYVLAGVFRVAAPEGLLARRTSALLGYLAALALAWLAWSLTRRSSIALCVFVSALVTPALFEISRLAFEVALYPLAVALFLCAASRASQAGRWSPGLIVALAATLALVTYSYTAGRLHGPAFAALLLLFATRARLPGLTAALVLYALVALLPMGLFELGNPGALSGYPLSKSYLGAAGTSRLEMLAAFERQLAANLLPLGMALRGDPNPRHHVAAGGSILLGTFALVALSLLWLRRRGFTRWWSFVVAGALLAVVPAALTRDVHHSLRLAAYPVFLILLTVPALQAASESDARWERAGVAAALLAMLLQSAFFMVQFHRRGGDRAGEFDAGARRTLVKALACPERPVFVQHGPDSAHASWFAALSGARPAEIARVPDLDVVPAGSLVFSSGEPCDGCRVVSRSGAYVAYYRR